MGGGGGQKGNQIFNDRDHFKIVGYQKQLPEKLNLGLCFKIILTNISKEYETALTGFYCPGLDLFILIFSFENTRTLFNITNTKEFPC